MERKEFLNLLGQTSVIVCGAGFFAACSKSNASPNTNNNNPPPGSVLASADLTTDLLTVGSAKTSGSIIIIRTGIDNSATSFEALSLVCTHMGCIVNYDSGSKDFLCPCHGSKYDLSGAVTNGPALKALAKYKVVVSGTSLEVM